MVLHIVQMDEHEWLLLSAVLDTAHMLRLNLEAGSYRGAIGDTDLGKALRRDLQTLVEVSKKARPGND